MFSLAKGYKQTGDRYPCSDNREFSDSNREPYGPPTSPLSNPLILPIFNADARDAFFSPSLDTPDRDLAAQLNPR